MAVVMVRTNVTAVPSPTAVLIWPEQAINEHIPRKFVKSILFVSIAAIRITMADVSVIYLFSSGSGPLIALKTAITIPKAKNAPGAKIIN